MQRITNVTAGLFLMHVSKKQGKQRGNARPTGNESVLVNSREIQEDDDIAWEDESRVGAIMISNIDRVHDGRPGRASAALKEMTDWADVNNKRLVLMPSGNIAGSKDNLVAWYERNGFVTQSDGAMIREPQGARNTSFSKQGEPVIKKDLEAAYLVGFSASREGYNNEYPFEHRGMLPYEARGLV